MTARLAALRTHHRRARGVRDIADSIDAQARIAFWLALLSYLLFPPLSAAAVALALRIRARIERENLGWESWPTTTTALIMSFGQMILVLLLGAALVLL